jgi:hypothetical protein
MTTKKEDLKTNIQKIFTQIRNALNEREEKIFQEIDKIFNFSFLNDEKMRKIERMPDKTKNFLKEVKTTDYNWKSNNLKVLINNCISIVNNAKEIEDINEVCGLLKKGDPLPLSIYYSYEFLPIEIQNKEIKSEEQDINKLFEYINNFGVLKNEGKIFTNSRIQLNEKNIKEWLDYRNFIPVLLYRKTADGSKPQDFHSKCDNQGNTMVFIQTTDSSVFGGYTEASWEGSGAKRDKSSFIFNYNGKYQAKDDKDCIYCDPNYGPTFGASSYYEILFDNSLDNGETLGGHYENYTFFNNRKTSYDKIDWNVKELEVYKIIYI